MSRYIYVKLLILTLVLGLVPAAAMAQPGSVNIVTQYQFIIDQTSKLVAPTTIEDDKRVEPTIFYQVDPSLWKISLDAHCFKPARASYWDHSNYKRLFAKAALGYPLHSEFNARYTYQTPTVGYLGVGVDHHCDFDSRLGYNDELRGMGQSYNMENRVGVACGYYVGKRLVEGALVYDGNIHNGYAMVDPERIILNDASLSLSFGDEFVDFSRLNFVAEVHGGVWSRGLPHSDPKLPSATEYRGGGSAKFSRNFSGNLVTLEGKFDLMDGHKSLGYRDMRFGIAADYARTFGFISLEAGLGYMFDDVKLRDKASHYVMPRAKVLFDLNKASFAPFVEVSTTLEQNDPTSLYKTNPYIDYVAMEGALSTVANTFNYNVSVGFTGTALSSCLAYQVYLGATFTQDKLFWYVTRPGMFGFATDSNSRIFAGVGAKYMPMAGLNLDFDFFYHYDDNSSKYLVSDSNMGANLGVEYGLRKWKVYAKGNMIGRRSWSVLPAVEGEAMGVFEMPMCVDLGVGFSYKVNGIAEVFVKGDNLLNSKIYDFANYYRNGAGFMVGAKIDF